jgi:MYXO-CTERM domain-containing protein
MRFTVKTSCALLGAALVAAPASALAKDDPVAKQANQVSAEAKELGNAVTKLNNTVANESRPDRDQTIAYSNDQSNTDGDRNDHHDDDLGKWGLLGLLGLAGLLGLKRRDDRDRAYRTDGPGYEDATTTRSTASIRRPGPETDTRL